MSSGIGSDPVGNTMTPIAWALVVSRIAAAIGLFSLFLSLSLAGARRRRPIVPRSNAVMAIATMALGLAFFALFFGLVAGCDRL